MQVVGAHLQARQAIAVRPSSSKVAALPRQRRTMAVAASAGPAIMVNSCTGKVSASVS